MHRKLRCIVPVAVLIVVVLGEAAFMAAQSSWELKAENVMTPQELKDTGLSGLTSVQREAFNGWLNRYTATVFNLASNQHEEESSPKQTDVKGVCAPAIESTIVGDFNGWDGETIFKLVNGQIWEQVEYSYTYSYSYRPDVTIYQVNGGCRMKVEDEDETIMVRRIK
jgi:hypothetical protein